MGSVHEATSSDAVTPGEITITSSHEASGNTAQQVELGTTALPSQNSKRPVPLKTSLGIDSAESEQLTEEDLYTCAWKYVGYKGYTQFIASESDFFVLRRFDAASVRVALFLQGQVSDLVGDLEAIDQACSQKSAPWHHNGSFRHETNESRVRIIASLQKKMTEYNAFVLQQAELRKLRSAARQDIISIQNWHSINLNAIDDKERAYLSYDQELFYVAPKERTALRRFLNPLSYTIYFVLRISWDGLYNHILSPLETKWNQFHAKRDPKSVTQLPIHEPLPQYIGSVDLKSTPLLNPESVGNAFNTFIIMAIGIGMLIAPMWTLQALTQPITKLAVITGFVVGFLILVSNSTTAEPGAVLAATAAYAAVLVVFLQFGSPA
ncbi:hypothetical protein L207DRAFT_570622 [Hyaloscypha variabilis F]|uniref:DUF6594 domain-containing protein n=1 Tax=Hyaloscypha variabilis (strain UAMH 11265 / GT02V1 / F) TaxID=1149755 RepID=A0A2J6R942_HYAVF|nr:hypothetical protein L207DRAFT_570622 [Hyaloscypha variabilis F]